MPYRQPTRDALEARLRAQLAERGELDAAIARTRRMLRPIKIRNGVHALLAITFWATLCVVAVVMILLVCLPCWTCCHGSPFESTRTDAQSVRSAAVMYVSEESGRCPEPEDLIEGGYLDRSHRTHDTWNHPFAISCEGDDVLVRSAGPDGEMFTEDDIQ